MGGERETKLSGGLSAASKPTIVESQPSGGGITIGPPKPEVKRQAQEIRIHENAGEVHFHVDSENLKVAVPVAEWFSAWEKLSRSPGQEWSYIDKSRNTLLRVKSGLIEGTLDAHIVITKVNRGEIYAELDKFTKKT